MTPDREKQIRARAFEIWEREGRPEGREQSHWEQARREIDGESAASPAAGPLPSGEGEEIGTGPNGSADAPESTRAAGARAASPGVKRPRRPKQEAKQQGQ